MRAIEIAQRRRERKRAAGRGRVRRVVAAVVLTVALAGVLAPLIGLGLGAAGLLAFVGDLPDVGELETLPARFRPATATTRLYAWGEPDASGQRQRVLIDEIADPRSAGDWARLGDLPPHVPAALLAAEDPALMSAAPRDLAAAVAEWRRTGAIPADVSPLIGRLVQTHLRRDEASPPGDARRALQDWFLSRLIERRYTREQILEWTLNTRYYGNLAYGIEAAARVYFGKGAANLTPGEAATLAVAAGDPAANPFDNPEAAQRGRESVLAAMTATGAIPLDEATAVPPALVPPPGSASPVPQFARLARRELEAILGPERLVAGGLDVETTLDLALQQQATCAAAAYAARLSGRPADGGPPCPARDYLPAATGSAAEFSTSVIALDPATGAIEALVGDAGAPRPLGATVLPLIYLTALSQGYTAATLTLDVQSVYLLDGQPYTPRDNGPYLGPLRLREALASGRAAPAAQVLSWVGAARVLATARVLGLPADSAMTGLALAEEGFLATLLDASRAWAVIANEGASAGRGDTNRPRPATVRRIFDELGQEVYAFEPITQEALASELAFLLTDALAGGTTTPALPDGRPAALVSDDGWAIGYTPEQLIGVRAETESGESADAAPLWRALMAWATADTPPADWSPPDGLRTVEVCAVSGLLPSRDGCPTVREWFVPGTEPAAVDTMTREAAVNRETGRLATIFTPPQLIERRVYTVYPPEATAWAVAAGIEPPPAEYDTIRRVPTRDGGAALSIEPWSVVNGQWSVVGSAGGDGFAYYRLAYFPGLLPEAMQTVVERGETPVEAAELGVWDTTALDDGLYTLLLTVIRQDGTFDEVAVPVSVTNGE